MAFNYLPGSAYFGAGAGPSTTQLRRDLQSSGFNNIQGPSDSTPAATLSITEPGKEPVQISPPGTAPKQRYDTGSLISITIGQPPATS